MRLLRGLADYAAGLRFESLFALAAGTEKCWLAGCFE